MPLINAMQGSRHKTVMEDTWGHMKPVAGKWYRGRVIFAWSDDGEMMVMRQHFGDERGHWPGGGPWFHIQFEAWTESLKDRKFGLYEWSGFYILYKNGNCRFTKGEWRKLY